ncbi:MAG: hypothetical protein M3530_01810 [Thermoproteota archaeon]|nr:hypothetical protein [Thermoproteota archaeon]
MDNRPSKFTNSFLLVFSNWRYTLIAGGIASIFWIVFNVFDQLLFFSPIVIFYLPNDAVVGSILSNIISILLGIVVGMNVYLLRHSKVKISLASFFSGSTVGVLSSTCASCSSLGFLLVSTLGGAGIAVSTFLSNYQTPLRVLSIVLLIWALYSISNKLTQNCKINYRSDAK